MRKTMLAAILACVVAGVAVAVGIATVTVYSMPTEQAPLLLPKMSGVEADVLGATREQCVRTLGYPERKYEYPDHNLLIVGEKWVYRGVAKRVDCDTVVDAHVWWNIGDGTVSKIYFVDPETGEVLR